MRIIHTSDWHLGRILYGRKRYEEHEAFLHWLVETIQRTRTDALLIAGDIFDTSTPSNRAQELYYRFLCQVASSSCRHVVIIAGNHDSPSFLNAPRELLKALNVHVVGTPPEVLEDEIILLDDDKGEVQMIVCAVPFLRDRNIRTAEAEESIEDKERKLIEGIRHHYHAVADAAERIRSELGTRIPLVAMGHLFTSGGQTVEGDGVRELYIGSLAHVHFGIFPSIIDYFALGHLHVPQTVSGSATIRYSGSPLPMGFGEAHQKKSVCLVDFHGSTCAVELIEVPLFQRLECLRGDVPALSDRLTKLKAAGYSAWLEVLYEGEEFVTNLRERLDGIVAGTCLEILRIKNSRIVEQVLGNDTMSETLDDLCPEDVLERCFTAHDIPVDQRAALRSAFRETLSSLHDDDAWSD